MVSSTTRRPGRDGSDVLLGALAGMFLGVAGILANLLLNRGDEQQSERRKDRLFGSSARRTAIPPVSVPSLMRHCMRARLRGGYGKLLSVRPAAAHTLLK